MSILEKLNSLMIMQVFAPYFIHHSVSKIFFLVIFKNTTLARHWQHMPLIPEAEAGGSL